MFFRKPFPRAGSSCPCPICPAARQGESREEALANAKEAIGLYLETLEEAGEPLLRPDREHSKISA